MPDDVEIKSIDVNRRTPLIVWVVEPAEAYAAPGDTMQWTFVNPGSEDFATVELPPGVFNKTELSLDAKKPTDSATLNLEQSFEQYTYTVKVNLDVIRGGGGTEPTIIID